MTTAQEQGKGEWGKEEQRQRIAVDCERHVYLWYYI
jgi:hypothetical protein